VFTQAVYCEPLHCCYCCMHACIHCVSCHHKLAALLITACCNMVASPTKLRASETLEHNTSFVHWAGHCCQQAKCMHAIVSMSKGDNTI
jgi:hypothetical protein